MDSVTSLLKTVTEKTKKPALEIIPSNLIMSTIAAGLTESSSSDSLTDSICTAYETRATKSQENGATSSSSTLKPNESNNVVMVDEEQIEVELSEPKEAEQVLGVGIISSMLEGRIMRQKWFGSKSAVLSSANYDGLILGLHKIRYE